MCCWIDFRDPVNPLIRTPLIWERPTLNANKDRPVEVTFVRLALVLVTSIGIGVVSDRVFYATAVVEAIRVVMSEARSTGIPLA